jgi:hypothetical protein
MATEIALIQTLVQTGLVSVDAQHRQFPPIQVFLQRTVLHVLRASPRFGRCFARDLRRCHLFKRLTVLIKSRKI